MFRGNLSEEQPWWEAEILWCLFRQSQILWKTNCQVKTLFCFLVAFTPKISSSMTCSYICSNICTTIKLSVRSQGSQSPWVVPLTYNKGFAALNLNVWWRGIPFPLVWFFLFVASPFTFLVKDEFYGFPYSRSFLPLKLSWMYGILITTLVFCWTLELPVTWIYIQRRLAPWSRGILFTYFPRILDFSWMRFCNIFLRF